MKPTTIVFGIVLLLMTFPVPTIGQSNGPGQACVTVDVWMPEVADNMATVRTSNDSVATMTLHISLENSKNKCTIWRYHYDEPPAGYGENAQRTSPAVTLNSDSSKSFFENLVSLGCDFVQSGMTQMAQAFLSDIVNSELVLKIAQRIIDEINEFVASLQAADPGHCAYVVTLLVLSPAGLKFTACPK